MKKVLVESFRTWLDSGTVIRHSLSAQPPVTIKIYIAHLLTFLFYGLIFDLIRHGIKKKRLINN
ncbi:hypothetical protein [Clostridium beijerinckii]|uniref:Uncharacterized protein n=1 Tax=Clostridium beijerinckii TaxID=1520 RepID=A0AAE5H3T8_CLOBE|nr:hypothetical protein [Clostridium beijerinckii]MDG5856686.1 hypothetical protein [Clostridium beijerinckii]NSB13903.1 hypothetical protein [Clostridium beijerinckii]OOM22786.1 hypothetical protein CLOBE_42830 [Clostridium beijerinckii]